MVRLTIARLAALAAAFASVSAAPLPGSHHAGDDSATGHSSATYQVDTTATTYAAHATTVDAYDSHTTTAPAMHDTTTIAAHGTTTTEAHATTTTTEGHATTTTTEAHATTTTAYGSGSHPSWGGDGYDSCVQQCMAQYGSPDATYTPPAATHAPTPTQGGAAATHTVIVAPTQGVLRMVPFAVSAAVGDTIKFVWGAGPHTVTQSSALQLCNASAGGFDSAKQNASFVYEQVVNTTETTFYYCAVGQHCSRGMFGVINPPTAAPDSNSTVASWMATAAQKDPDVAAMWSYTSSKTAGTSAETWGSDIDISKMPEDAYGVIAENVMYGQLFYSANPGLLENGKGASAPPSGLSIPQDITAALAAQPSSPTTQVAPTGPAAPVATSDSNKAAPEANPAATSGARSVVASTAVVGMVALLASVLAL